MSENLMQLAAAEKSFGAKNLFHKATFSINQNEHVGVIGANGTGKTTLFKMLLGKESLDKGELIRSKILRIGYLEQEVKWAPEETLTEYLSPCELPLWDLKVIGKKLGLSEELFERPILSMSGGYRMRCKLLYLLGFAPNLMLLDEPTNYLDLETVILLEHFLQEYNGAFLLISHDREFLRRTTDHIIEIENQDITKYNGNIDDYFEQKALLREQLEKQRSTQDSQRKNIEEFVARFGAKATKARQAQSRLKLFEKQEKITVKPLQVKASIRIPEPTKSAKVAAIGKNLTIGYNPAAPILRDVNFEILYGEHIAVVGYNGVGKSTFLKLLAQRLSPFLGQTIIGQNVTLGYFGQHVSEELNPALTVLDELRRECTHEVKDQDVLDLAGSLLFSGEAVQKKISLLSGGEKARVALGKILLKRVNFLLLDEPTNHLDFDTVEALTQALKNFSGTIVFVSHDRSFVSRVANKIFEISNGELTTYLGDYDHYVWKIEKEQSQIFLPKNEATSEKKKVITTKENPKLTNQEFFALVDQQKKQQKIISQNKRLIGELDKKIEKIHLLVSQLTEQIQNNCDNMALVSQELFQAQRDLEKLESSWLIETEQLEKTEIEYELIKEKLKDYRTGD